ncbi:hypothetical protein [Cellulomonas xiejunii]|uniref:PIN domain-containing protein n=1 Tax=Cellulomonas xiejunii TaxID=2968083 RepID=A0ABY5KNS5_9CELL|nr:hypothetical protein [Cellulomonas xiejunii]MCC2319673.1 hypothetical protein [Cellulomonas xiejunii]UUI71388.1 hypothetical protein NP048_16585 [Cellulomonas xiejunii]
MPAPRRVPRPEVLLARDPAADVYVDGSALSRYLPAAPEARPWAAWVAEHEPAVVISRVSVLEARVTAGLLGTDASLVVLDALTRLPVMRLSDQALRRAVLLPPGLGPFAALHVGAALAHVDVVAIATYDAPTARAAEDAGLAVVSPGRPATWWR